MENENRIDTFRLLDRQNDPKFIADAIEFYRALREQEAAKELTEKDEDGAEREEKE